MDSNNKKRLLYLIEIMKRVSDQNRHLSINEIMELLERRNVHIANRKTIYDDFKILEECGYNIDYKNNGYYLTDSPFSLSEVKIMIDSLHSLKNIDDKVLNRLDDKLYSFISMDEEKQLKKLEYKTRHSDENFINRVEDILYAIDNGLTVIISNRNKKESEIGPCFLYRENNYYYLYYHYLSNEKLYKTRFDNIVSLKITENKDSISIPKSSIISYIEEGTAAFNKGKAQLIKFEIINPSEQLNSYLKDNFSNIIFTRNGFSIRSSVNDALFSRLTMFKDDIKISNRDIADQYIEFLNRIIIRNK